MAQEVMLVTSHLLITLAVLGCYLVTLLKGAPDETLRNLLMVIGGYWFGVVGKIGSQQIAASLKKAPTVDPQPIAPPTPAATAVEVKNNLSKFGG